MFLIRLVILPVRLVLGSLAVGYKAGRLVGFRRVLTFALGVGVGLLLAPVPGRQLRERVRAAIEGASSAGSPEELADQVRSELSQSPRTWHLPTPSVEVADRTVVLRGEVPHELGREDMQRTVASVPGVEAVDNQLVVHAEPTLLPAETPVTGPGTRSTT